MVAWSPFGGVRCPRAQTRRLLSTARLSAPSRPSLSISPTPDHVQVAHAEPETVRVAQRDDAAAVGQRGGDPRLLAHLAGSFREPQRRPPEAAARAASSRASRATVSAKSSPGSASPPGGRLREASEKGPPKSLALRCARDARPAVSSCPASSPSERRAPAPRWAEVQPRWPEVGRGSRGGLKSAEVLPSRAPAPSAHGPRS